MAQFLCHSFLSGIFQVDDVDNCVICWKIVVTKNNHKRSALRDRDIMLLRPIKTITILLRDIIQDL